MRFSKSNILIPALVIALSACATPYQDMGLTGGVQATRIDESTVRIKATGNGFTSLETTQNYVMLKAAEETLASGFDLFLIVDSDDYVKSTLNSYSSGSASASCYGWSCSAYGSSSSTAYTIDKPRSNSVVKMFTGEKPADAPPNLYDAHEVARYLGQSIVGPEYAPPIGQSIVGPEYAPPRNTGMVPPRSTDMIRGTPRSPGRS